MHRHARQFSLVLLLLLLPLSTLAGPLVLFLTKQDFDDSATNTPSTSTEENSVDLDDDSLDLKSVDELDPGSWRPIFEPDSESSPHTNPDLSQYYSSIRKMLSAVTSGDSTLMQEAGKELEATGGFAAQSVLGFLFGTGQLREKNGAKAFLHHHFASQGGSMQSKMAMAYTYYRQHMTEEAVELYAELAEAAVSNLLISKDPAIETIRIHSGTEENKEGLRKSRGEDDEEFQVIEYQAQKGNAEAMHRMGMFYYFGLRGLRRDYRKAVAWFLKAVVKGDPLSMEVLGEMYVRGVGVERNYTKAFEWLMLASKREHFSAYNGLGYLYLKGYGVEKNHTKAMEYFENAKENDETAAYYNLGMVYLRGIGVKKDIKIAREFFIKAAVDGQPKAYFQLAKMFHSGIGLRKNLVTATELYKIVAERGPWSSLSRWALESYIKGEVGKALLLYSRLAELGYEVAQSNAAWILDKYGEHSMCFGGSGLCTDAERHRRTHDLWWRATEQRNEHAALLIGDAYYYGRGTEVDYERAAEAYMHARSQSNAQAMFNLGYMHEHGYGLPFDLHLAKRYYDQALESDPAAKLPVTLALVSLWIRQNYANSFLVNLIDSLPEVYPKVGAWVRNVILDEGNVTILTLFVCLLTVLYLRERQRRHAAADIQQQPNDHDIAAPN